MHKSTKDVPFEFFAIEGGGTYGVIQVSPEKTGALGMLGKYSMSKGVQFAPHRHKDWVVVTVISGKLQLAQRNQSETCTYLPGESYLVEPGAVHTETALEDTVVVVVNGPRVNSEQFAMRTVDVDTVKGSGPGS